jgi:hypothetical protein
MENDMLVDLRTRGSRRVLLTCQAILPTLTVLMTTVSCSTPVQQIRRQEEHRTSASPKVVSRHVEKANTPPLLDAKKEQLFQEFLEWQRRHRDTP